MNLNVTQTSAALVDGRFLVSSLALFLQLACHCPPYKNVEQCNWLSRKDQYFKQAINSGCSGVTPLFCSQQLAGPDVLFFFFFCISTCWRGTSSLPFFSFVNSILRCNATHEASSYAWGHLRHTSAANAPAEQTADFGLDSADSKKVNSESLLYYCFMIVKCVESHCTILFDLINCPHSWAVSRRAICAPATQGLKFCRGLQNHRLS